MHQFDVIIINNSTTTEKTYQNCYDRFVELGYNKNNIQSIITLRPLSHNLISSTHPKYKNYRNSSHRTDSDFENFYNHFRAWKKCIELDKSVLITEDYRWQQWPIPGNINKHYTEVLNLSAGEWEFENSILSLENHNNWYIGKDDDYNAGFLPRSLSNFDAYLITPLGCKKALDIVVKYGYMIPRVMFNSVLFDVKYFRRKLFI